MKISLWLDGKYLRLVEWEVLPRIGEEVQLGSIGGSTIKCLKVAGITHEIETGVKRVYLKEYGWFK